MEITSQSLVGRLRSHDDDAWMRFSAIYCPMVYRWARQSGLQPSDTEDVVQEVFRGIANSIDAYVPVAEPGSFRRWMWGIARNKIRDHFRSVAKTPQAAGGSTAHAALANIPELPPDEASGNSSFDSDAWVVQRALGLLQSDFQETTWRAFWMMAIECRSAAETSNSLGISKKAVRQAKYRVLQRLRLELQGQFDESPSDLRGAPANSE